MSAFRPRFLLDSLIPWISKTDSEDLTDGGLTSLHYHKSRNTGVEIIPGISYAGSDVTIDGTGLYWVNTATDYSGATLPISPTGATFSIAVVETTYYIYAFYNAGVPVLAVTTNEEVIHDGDKTPICRVIRTGTTAYHTTWYDSLSLGLADKLQHAIEHIIGPKVTGGLALGTTGIRYLTVEPGSINYGAIKTLLTAVDTSAGDTYRFIYWDGAVWQNVSATQLDNTQFQDVGGLGAITGSRYSINWIWRGIEEQKHVYILLGEGNFTYDEALNSSPPVPPAWVTDHAALLGRILFQRADNTAIVQEVSSLGYALVGAIQHNNTTGKQGGTTGEYYHLTAAQHTDLTDIGDSTLHYHSADRVVEIEKEAGEDLVAGNPVRISANKFYKASHATDPDVVGIIKVSTLTGFLATAVVSGPVTLSGLTADTPYFLGVDAIASSAPASGYVTKVGQAISTTILLVSIENPVLLS